MSQARIAPSESLAKAAEELVSKVDREAHGSSLLGELAQLGARKLIQETLEAEQAEYLARDRYERRDAGAPALYRNGYEPGRLQIGEGWWRSGGRKCGAGRSPIEARCGI